MNFRQLFTYLGFRDATFKAVTECYNIHSFDQFKGRRQLITELRHSALDHISKREQERLYWALLHLSNHCGVRDFDFWIEDNEFDAAALLEVVVSNTPQYAAELVNLTLSGGMLFGETDGGNTVLCYAPAEHPNLGICTGCKNIPADKGVLRACRCGRVAYCSWTCYRAHWKVHQHLCRSMHQQ